MNELLRAILENVGPPHNTQIVFRAIPGAMSYTIDMIRKDHRTSRELSARAIMTASLADSVVIRLIEDMKRELDAKENTAPGL